MAYDINFTAYSGSDWAQSAEAVDDATNLPIDLSLTLIELAVRDRCNAVLLQLSSEDGTITKPTFGQFQWVVPKEKLGAFCPGTTYRVGCRMTVNSQRLALFTGSLAYLNGEVA